MPLPRVVAVDMDGTFLRSDNTYDRARFARVHRALREAGCRFVVASGNQREQLASFFEAGDVDAFVAENGALVTEGDRVHFCAELDDDVAARAVEALEASGIDFLASGPDGAFVLDSAADDFVELMAIYYHRLQRVPRMPVGTKRLFKFGTEVPSGLPAGLKESLDAALGGALVPVSSGHASLDLIIPGCHKASGLQRLLNAWGVAASDVVAFGDSANDLEMLRLAGVGVAMENATDVVKLNASTSTASNNRDGVLDYLENLLAVTSH